jgi:hypothetical protein
MAPSLAARNIPKRMIPSNQRWRIVGHSLLTPEDTKKALRLHPGFGVRVF